MVAPAGEGLSGLLQSNATQWRAYLTGLMRQMGVDPSRNIYAAQSLNRAPEAQWLAQAMNTGEGGIQDFAKQWVNARIGQGGQYGGVDLSRQGMSNWVQGALKNNDPTSQTYKMFNTGDPETDYANLGSAMGIVQGGYSPMAQRAEQKALADWYMTAINQMQGAGVGTPTNLLDYYFGRANAGAPPPQGATPGAPPGAPTYNPNPTPTTPPATTPPATTPPAGTPPAGTPPAGTPPAGTPPGAAPAAQSITNWQQLLNKFRGDQRNWGTEGYRPNPGAFTIGGFSYDPNQDQVRDWRNMGGSDSGGLTQRGNFMGQFLYYLQLLMNQRNNQGNTALGITRQTTDDELARIAAQRMGRNAVGSSGFTIRT
jgi:hypothetical protein